MRAREVLEAIEDEGGATTTTPTLFELEEGVVDRQISRTEERIAGRDPVAHGRAMKELDRATLAGDNVMPALIEATRAGATVGEMSDVFREAFGEFREPAPW